ncbi:MAG: hypothetical protein JNK54_04475 [Elusimicrobia bacterium]|jgi:hypothetical protein|nr:hypothetical protein [Elusimicrobiota bacterium]
MKGFSTEGLFGSGVFFAAGAILPFLTGSASPRGLDRWVLILFCAALAGISFWKLWKYVRLVRAVEDTPTAKVGSASQGEVELAGTAVAVEGKTLVCPLTGNRCLWYSFKVERYESRGKSSSWVTLSSGQSSEAFGLQDETGTVLVVPFDATFRLRQYRRWKGSTASPLAPGGDRGFFSGFHSYRYTEELIVPGETVYVLGWFESLSGTSSLQGDLHEKLREIKRKPQEMMARFDSNKDGMISGEEWDAARAVVEAEMDRERALIPPSADVHLVRSPPADTHTPFLISSFSQEELATTYKRRAWIALGSFLAFGSISVFVLR